MMGIGYEENGVSEMRVESETPVCLEREWRCGGSVTKIAPTQKMGEGEEGALVCSQ